MAQRNDIRETDMTITRRTFGLGAAGALIAPVAAPLIRRASAAGPAIRIDRKSVV